MRSQRLCDAPVSRPDSLGYVGPLPCRCVKLCDFGFCQQFRTHKEAEFTFNCGTLEYYAPELSRTAHRTHARHRALRCVPHRPRGTASFVE